MGVVITPDDIKNKRKVKKVARDIGMEPEELEKLLKRGKSIEKSD